MNTEEGQGLIEYALILGVIFCVVMIVIGIAQNRLDELFIKIVKWMNAL